MSMSDQKMNEEATGLQWGDKGCAYRPDKCDHEPDDGCEWCCMQCNLDRHWCPDCGTVSDHKNSPCGDCMVTYGTGVT